MSYRLLSNPKFTQQPIQSCFQIFCGVLIISLVTITHANTFQDCSESFYAGVTPDYLEPNLTKKSQALCFNGFATMYSGVSRTPLWSAEYLTRERIAQAEKLSREDNFHEESRLPKSIRAKLSDYSGSGYDRGHIAPNGDMATRSQQYDSFSLANIAPQSPRNNRYVWRNLEEATRRLTKQYGEVYVVTGVAFTQKRVKKIGQNVLVPSHFFKAVYIPAISQAGVYYAPNDESERLEIISLDDLALRTGMDVMPAIDSSIKAQAFELPRQASDVVEKPSSSQSENDQQWWLILIIGFVDWLIAQLSQS